MSALKMYWLTALLVFSAVMLPLCSATTRAGDMELPKPRTKGKTSLEEALKSRRTWRSFQARALSLEQLSQILWAAYGVTGSKDGYHLKTSPSAGALYPIDVYAVVGQGSVRGLKPAVYHFEPAGHGLAAVKQGDLRKGLADAALSQMWMAQAPAIMVVTGESARCTRKYGKRGVMYTHIEAGHVGQNIFLQAEALGLKAGIVGAFNNQKVIETLGLPASHDPLLLMPVGYGD